MGMSKAAAPAVLLRAFLLASLLVAQGACQVLGDVFLYEAGDGDKEVHFDPFADLPADFGPEVPDEGVDGLLFVADPEDACEPLRNRYDDDEPWVALISRSQHLHPTNCTFDVKVHNAELAGASAAIVYDDVYEALIIMSKPRDHPEPGIPAVFVSEKAGIIMRKLMTPGVTRVRIVPVSASAWMSLLMSAFLGFLALTVVLATFYVMRSWSMWLGRTRRRGMAPELAGFGALGAQPVQEGLPACAIRALPILIYEGKPGKHRRSSSSSTWAPSGPGDVMQQQVPSASVPIAVPAAGAAAAGGSHVAWLAGSPAMPETPQAAAAGDDARHGQHADQARRTAADAAGVLLTESDSEVDVYDGHRAWQQQQHAGGLSHRLASSSSAVTSGLISLASLAAAGSRRVLLLGGGPSPSTSPSTDAAATVAAATAATTAAAAAGPCEDSSSSSVRSPAEAGGATAAAAAVDGAGGSAGGSGGGCASPTGAASCHSSLLSTDDEDGDLPEVVQSWPGAGGMARVVTGGPVGARGGATRHTCVVCLERYAAGDKVRVLPCQHRFHAKCIDPWLASRRLCPVCKHDASTWPSNSLQAALSGAVPLDTPVAAAAAAAAAGGAGAAEASAGGVSLLSPTVSAGVVSLVGRGYFFSFRRLRARLARASRRRQQQQQEQQQLLAGGGMGLGLAAASSAAVADAAEAGLLQPPPTAVTVDVHQEQHPVMAQSALLQQQLAGQQGQLQQASQQQRRARSHHGSGSVHAPLLPEH